MPKTSVDKDGEFILGKVEVRPTRDVLWMLPPAGNFRCPQESFDHNLGRAIAG